MDRRGLIAAAVLALGCGGGLAPLGDGRRPGGPAARLAVRQVARRGALGYRAAFVGRRVWLAVELGLRFELVIRRLDEGRAREVGRVDLGPPDWDVTALATAPGVPRAWLGSMDGTVRVVDVGRRRVTRTWHAGYAVTAVAASPRGRWVAVGTDRGVLCLRRARDGALVQCLVAHRARISALAAGRDRLVSAAWDGSVAVWSLPALRRLGSFAIAGSANAVTLSPDGSRIAVAASARPPGRAARANPAAAGPGWVTTFALAGSNRRLACRRHRAPATAVVWAGERRLLEGGWDATVRLLSLDGGGCRELSSEHLGGHLLGDLVLDAAGREAAAALWVDALDQPAAVLLDVL